MCAIHTACYSSNILVGFIKINKIGHLRIYDVVYYSNVEESGKNNN